MSHAAMGPVTLFALLSIGTINSAWAQDHIDPPMVNISAGSFMMGSPSGDKASKPMHVVQVQAFQMAKYPVTVAEFKKFVADTGFNPEPTCSDYISETWMSGPDYMGDTSWDKHRYQNNDYLPVTCISWQDANTYADWLSKKTGQKYRLPTEQEWEYAVKANTTSRYFWGDDLNMTQACAYGNFADQSGEYFASKQYGASYVGFLDYANCDDGEPYNSIVGLYRPNPFGLHDMVGNVSQYLGSCYYPEYIPRTEQEMDLAQCEYVAHRGGNWHYPPGSHASRSRAKREDPSPWALMGFRLAADGQAQGVAPSTQRFETDLKHAQKTRLATRPKLPKAPQHTQLDQLKQGELKLTWQASQDPQVIAYEIYQSNYAEAHLLGQFFKRHYKKVNTVKASAKAKRHEVEVQLPAAGGSFRVVAVTKQLTSLPSEPAAFVKPRVVKIPGLIDMKDTIFLENVRLKRTEAKEDKAEFYYLSKLNKGLEQPLVTASFKVDVKTTAWYKVNYRGNTRITGGFYKLWQNNRLAGEIHYDPNSDTNQPGRDQVFLQQGKHTLQLTVQREGWDYWSLGGLKFTEVKDKQGR